ncbi:ethylbenzene dehydrogenase-related protein [Litorilinea aerophila]|uniref:Cytochrome c-552/DMSO reductase-like haem-binding domain-containing protein n=1 Tax=Litorilinea aerophila TaxID=1204385 RepID=A0A540VKM2_9CHLR|nr:ethylbenzene dehydrogenase-related protein [Litorilinea aerophila]MCC9075003.1 ethylbenzene dehydrogenase-related protein [Litorilinea aerophila]OUC07864.1 hypothetical protein RY27_12345 [Litorilinea aerophila]
MWIHSRLSMFLVLGLALASLFFQVPLASSQGLTITAVAVEGDLPMEEPDAALWQQATAVEVPLSAQMITRPILPDTNIKSITVRALHNGQSLAMLLEWADATRNDSTLGLTEFRDSVAIQFPLIEGQPFFCMGQQGGDVNIWHWKADWQAELLARRSLQDVYPNIYVDTYPFTEPSDNLYRAAYVDPNYRTAEASGNLLARSAHSSPVEDLVAGGFGSLTSQPLEGQNVQGYGEWRDGVWRVIFSRSLISADAGDVVLAPGKNYSVAFAAWDGANRERNGVKSTSQWVSLQLAAPVVTGGVPEGTTAVTPLPAMRLPLWAWLAILVLLTGVVVVTLFYFYLGEKS